MLDTLGFPLDRQIFCHAMWRTGSTALFNAFRTDDRFMCFYEPLHEGVGSLTIRKAREIDSIAAQRMGHDGLLAPYFWEYRHVVKRRGVRHFPTGLSYASFFDVNQEDQVRLAKYFGALAEHAWSCGRIPVFCLNRSWGRINALRNITPNALHVFSLREPAPTFRSFQKRRGYFFAKLLMIFANAMPNLVNESFPEVADLNVIERWRKDSTFKKLMSRISDERMTHLFSAAFSIATLNGLSQADYVIDLSLDDAERDDRFALAAYISSRTSKNDTSVLSCAFQRLADRRPLASTFEGPSLTLPAPKTDLLLGGLNLPLNTAFASAQAGSKKLSRANQLWFAQLADSIGVTVKQEGLPQSETIERRAL